MNFSDQPHTKIIDKIHFFGQFFEEIEEKFKKNFAFGEKPYGPKIDGPTGGWSLDKPVAGQRGEGGSFSEEYLYIHAYTYAHIHAHMYTHIHLRNLS